MSKMHKTVKLQSQLMRHGQSQVATQKGAAFTAKMNQMLGQRKIEQSSTSKKERVIKAINEQPKNYFTNTAATRAHIIIDTQLGEDTSSDVLKSYYALVNCSNFDYNEAKVKYKEVKDKLTQELVQRFPNVNVLPKEATIEYQRKLHDASFMCWKHQLIFIIWSEDEFEGGEYDENRKIWVCATTSKAVYTLDPITQQQMQSIINGSTEVKPELYTPRAKSLVRDMVNGVELFRPLKPNEDIDDFIGDEN